MYHCINKTSIEIFKIIQNVILTVELLQLSSNYILFRIFKGFGDFSEALFLSCNSSTYIRDNIISRVEKIWYNLRDSELQGKEMK